MIFIINGMHIKITNLKIQLFPHHWTLNETKSEQLPNRNINFNGCAIPIYNMGIWNSKPFNHENHTSNSSLVHLLHQTPTVYSQLLGASKLHFFMSESVSQPWAVQTTSTGVNVGFSGIAANRLPSTGKLRMEQQFVQNYPDQQCLPTLASDPGARDNAHDSGNSRYHTDSDALHWDSQTAGLRPPPSMGVWMKGSKSESNWTRKHVKRKQGVKILIYLNKLLLPHNNLKAISSW